MSDAILPVRPAMVTAHPARLSGAASKISLKTGAAIALLAGLAASAIVSIGMRAGPRIEPAPPIAAGPTPPVWIEIAKPVRIYSLEARELAKLPATYAARRLSIGDTREDVLGFGSWRVEQPSLRLSIVRGTGAKSPPLDTAIVRQAADVGMAIGRSKMPETLSTRFGAFDVADVVTTGDRATLQCSGFRLALSRPALTFAGFACGAGGHPIPRRALGCLIDRLDLASVGEDRALIDFFAATDLRRDAACDGMRLGPDGVHAAWLDDKSKPPLPAEGRSTSRNRRHHRH